MTSESKILTGSIPMRVQMKHSSLLRRVVRIVLWTAGGIMLVLAVEVVLLMQFAQSSQPISHRVERPGELQTVSSRHLVELHWKPVDGATSYEVFRADSRNGHYGQLAQYVLAPVLRRFFESILPPDFLLAVPQSSFADGTVKPGVRYYYKVRAQDGSHPGEFSDPAAGQSNESDPGLVAFQINSADLSGPPLRNNWSIGVGADHLGYLFKGDASPQIKNAGTQYRAANKYLHDSLGMRYIRAHGILSEGVVCRHDGTYDFSRADAIYDKIVADGMMPFVELSFMPACLAANPKQTIMSYSGIISPPRDYKAWGEFVRQFVAHLAERYGNKQVRQWYFEVWNEPDLRILWLKKFWKGSPEEYFRLYDYAATAVKSVDPAFRVGGPVGEFSATVEPFLKHVTSENFATGGASAPLDFFDMHVYWSSPADWRPVLKRYGLEKTAVIFTEWGASAASDSEVNDGPYGAAWSVGSVMSSSDSLEMMFHFAGTDYFEESGAPNRFFHGGYGLLGFDQIRKPSYWAFYLLNEMQGTRLKVAPVGAGPASALVNVIATRNGEDISILVASLVPSQSLSNGVPELARRVFLNLEGLDSGKTYSAKIERIDNDHSNVRGAWLAMGSPVWPNPNQLSRFIKTTAYPPPSGQSRSLRLRQDKLSLKSRYPCQGLQGSHWPQEVNADEPGEHAGIAPRELADKSARAALTDSEHHFKKSALKEKRKLEMTITGLNFKRITAYAVVCGATLALSIASLQAQAPASPAPATASVPAPAKSTLTIHLTGFENAKGKVSIDLFRDGKGFPLDPTGVVESKRLDIDPKTLSATATFTDLPQGVYAAVAIHDDNLTGKMEFNASGIPLKGCGFSNNPDTMQGPPTPESATFSVNQPETKIEIKIVYFQ